MRDSIIQDKENTVWKATLNIANTAYGEKVLYDINPIEMVEQSVKSDTVSTNDSIAQKSNTVNTIISEKSKNSTEKYSDRDYSYDNLVSKPDMKVTQIGTEAPSNRADIVFEAKRNASKIGKFNVKDGSVSVYVDDIGTDVILGTDGLKHGLRRSKNISTDINSLAILNAGEIIKHSVKINELIPKDKNATSSYVLIGCAENSSSRFIVRSIINTFDNSLSKMDVLYAVKVKESAAQPAPGSAAKAVSSVTDSKISITDLLEIVNRHYPDILPESVLKHFGYSERPSGDLAVSALYSFRDTKSGMANDKLSPYGEELSQFIEQKGDYIVDNFDKLKQVVNLAFDSPSVKATAYFGIINRETLSEIKESIPNLPKASKEILFKDGRDYSVATTLDSIRHIVDEKGLSRDDVIDYLDRLADTVVDFDTVSFDYYYDSYKNRIPGLLFKKSFEDGKLISFDIVSQKKRSLSLQAIYLESVDYEKKKSAETLLLQNSHSRTPEVGVGQTSDNRVAQFDDNVKGKIEKSLDSDCDGVVKDATQLTEGDLRYLLEQIQEGELDTGYIPVARTTPQFYIDVVNEHSKGKTEVMKVPLASSVEHMMQNMEEYDGSTYEDDKTPHGLSTDDIITISKEMIHPKYIVLQRNGRYAEVVSFFSEKRKKQVVLSIDFAEDGESPKNFKHEQYMNGYNGGYYNIIVTEYEPTDLKSYLKNNEIVYDRQRMNGKYQVGSGRIVTVTHDTPFIQQDNTTVSDKSQEEALDKKQSKKKNLKDIEPTNYLNPNRIIPVNNITDKEKYEYLVSEFDKNGYSGRPVVVVTEDGFADDSSSMYSAVTGSHRILAATEAEIDVPVYEIHMNDENAERIMELVDANEDSERARIAKELFEDGIISEEAYSLIEREDELNYENDDVSYSEQLRYSDRDEGLKDFVEKRKNSILSEYGIDRIGDYVQVQKRVYQGLREKGFFTNEEKTSRKDVNEASGMIVYTNRKGINETFNYGNFAKSSNALKLLKILTVEKIPELIQNGQLIDDNVENFHGLKNEFAYISGKVNIDGLDINMWLAIKKTEAKNRFWVHYVGIKSDIDETTSTGSSNSRMAFRNTNVANGDYTISKLKSQEEAFDKLYSDRDITLSSRYLLANALESTARNEVERDWLGRYKADIEKYNAEQDKLTTLNAQIKELSFGKGKRDMTKLRQLRDEKIKTENRITIYDKRLLRIEAAKPLQNVIEREKTKAKNKALQQGREALEAYKKTAAQKLREEVALRKEPFCRPRLFKF